MLMLIKSRLRLIWWLLTGAIVITSLVPGVTLHDPRLTAYINTDWAHFLAYAAAGAVTLLAWRLRTGLAISSGLALLSFALQLLRGLASGQGMDVEGAVTNLLGLAAGVLIGLHIYRFQAHNRDHLAPNALRLARAVRPESISLREGQNIDRSPVQALDTAVTE
jgi:hypothetical protein